MTPNITREYRIYLAIWRKAYRERDKPEPLFINASNQSTAISIQSAMYRAIRPYRTGQLFDAELKGAAENFILYLPKDEDPSKPHTIYLRHRKTLDELESELARLGIDEADLLTEEEIRINQQLNKLIGIPENTDLPPMTPPVSLYNHLAEDASTAPEFPLATSHKPNPFYTRED